MTKYKNERWSQGLTEHFYKEGELIKDSKGYRDKEVGKDGNRDTSRILLEERERSKLAWMQICLWV